MSWFYLLFHSFLNTVAELLYFADRDFYQYEFTLDTLTNRFIKKYKYYSRQQHMTCL